MNLDPKLAKDRRLQQLQELEEWRAIAYDSSKLYKERIARLHDTCIVPKEFMIGDKVLLYNSKFKISPGKLRSKWSGPFTVTNVNDYGICGSWNDAKPFRVNGHRLKKFEGMENLKVNIITFVEK